MENYDFHNLQEPLFITTQNGMYFFNKINPNKRNNKQNDKSEINFVLYDKNDEGSKMTHVYACKYSVVRAIIFYIIASFTLFPFLIIKWSIKARRFFLYEYSEISEATHLFICDTSIFRHIFTM